MVGEIRIRPGGPLTGRPSLPPDKSIAHRAAILSALADGTSRIVNYPGSADPQSTLACLKQLGVEMEVQDEILVIHGKGLRGLVKPDGLLDCGNSGTTMRLLAGVLAGQPFESTLTGDASVSTRPMTRIAQPLRMMGADIQATDGHAPLVIRPVDGLRGLSYELPVASAQVKSCVLLAGLMAEGETEVIELVPTRDHTERMLSLPVVEMGGRRVVSVEGGSAVVARTWSIPADFSAAAFFLVAGSILEGSSLHLTGVGLNPSRTALLDVLRGMGARVDIRGEREVGGESIGDIYIRYAPLSGVRVPVQIIANLIDEIPILCVAAVMADGETVIRGAAELRHKESDRIDAMAQGLRAMGADVEEFEDGLSIRGGRPLKGARLDSMGDHRVAMALAVAALAAEGESTLTGPEAAAVSFPGFFEAIDTVR